MVGELEGWGGGASAAVFAGLGENGSRPLRLSYDPDACG
jgi:hypothetical protein